eukprot:TRINITY_DN316_c2_g1_i3.p1 TRINITY_DN316_c2_g1~~TRINITY_DN316_c2_g1_i3.p1  ORF type:complete len:689 (+),score=265.74 TRINITY_DN316_c2_g1_i3:110-2068(+)
MAAAEDELKKALEAREADLRAAGEEAIVLRQQGSAASEKEEELQRVNEANSTLQAELDELKSKQLKWKESVKAKIEQSNEKVKAVEDELRVKAAEVEEYSSLVEQSNRAAEAARSEAAALQEALQSSKGEVDAASEECLRLKGALAEASQNGEQAQQELANARKELEELQTRIEDLSSSSRALEVMEQEKQAVQRELDAATDVIKGLEEKIAAVTAAKGDELNEFKESAKAKFKEKMETERQLLREQEQKRIDTLKAKTRAVKEADMETIKNLRAEIAALKDATSSGTIETANLKAQLEEVTADLEAAKGRTAELETAVQEAKVAAETELNEVRAAGEQQLQATINKAKAKIKEFKDAAESHAARLVEYEQVVSSKNTEVESLRGEVQALTETGMALEEQMRQQEACLQERNDAMDRLHATVEELRTTHKDSEHQLSAAYEEAANSKAELSDVALSMQTSIDELKMQLSEAVEKQMDASSRLQDVLAEKEALETSHTTSSQLITNLQEDIRAAAEKEASLVEELGKIKEQLADVEGARAQLDKQREEAEGADPVAVQNEIKRLTDHNNYLQQQVSTLQHEHERKKHQTERYAFLKDENLDYLKNLVLQVVLEKRPQVKERMLPVLDEILELNDGERASLKTEYPGLKFRPRK